VGTQLFGTTWCKPTQNVSNRYFCGTFRTSSSVVCEPLVQLSESRYRCISFCAGLHHVVPQLLSSASKVLETWHYFLVLVSLTVRIKHGGRVGRYRDRTFKRD